MFKKIIATSFVLASMAFIVSSCGVKGDLSGDGKRNVPERSKHHGGERNSDWVK